MNERIRELWDKAAKSTAAYPSGQHNSWETQVNFIDKFAELIVAEMLHTCEEHPGWSGRMIGEQIKQHFGVDNA